ncbi:Golgi complex component 7-domain-containing protein, partial [Mrakia frigida]|uniref:Golgi complex component 7-domain-containing protein n=1 Tax=Mrakia frigida TaxID=29902 RepID=UPI003FCBEEEA
LASLDPYEGDVSGWLNDLLDPLEDEMLKEGDQVSSWMDLTALDNSVRTLLGRLSGISQDTSAQLEQTIHDISRTVPRLTYDLQFMRESAASLHLSLHTVEAKSASSSSLDALNHSSLSPTTEHGPEGDRPDQETVAVLERLTYLDKVKTGMESTLAVLLEAESWSSLEAEFTSLLADSLFSKAAVRLSEASKSVSVFTHNTTEYEARRSLLLSLQNHLEASLSAALVKAINEKDKDGCRSFFGIFGMIQREGEFRGYYYGSRRAAVVDMWDKAKLVDCGESSNSRSRGGALDFDMAKSSSQETGRSAAASPPPPTSLNIFLPQFYTNVLLLISEERTLLPAIFPDPQPTLSSFIISIFDALAPSLPQRLESLLEFHGPAALTELIKSFKATEDLAVGIQSTMDKLGFSAAVFATSPGPIASASSPGTVPTIGGGSDEPKTTRSRRFSRRLTAFSISVPRIESLDSSTGGAGGPWENAIFEPFLDFQSEYASLESRLLASQLDREIGSSSSSSSFGGGEGEDSARIVWERSVAVFGMVEGALERCLAFTHGYGAVGLVGSINELFASFLKRCGALFKDGGARPKTGKKSGRNGDADDELDSIDFDGMDYTSEDWGTFQLALHLLGTCRGIQDRLASFESKLILSLHQVAQAFLAARDDPSGLFVSGTTRGAISLLQQSSLNTKELYELLEHLPAPSSSSHTQLKTPSFFPPSPAVSHTFGAQVPSTPQSNSSSPLPHLLDPSRKSLTQFTISSQLFLQQTILSPLHHLLSTYPSLPVWTQITPAPSKKSNALVVPTFSLDPTDIVSRVGEGLLNLPRLFEVYADDDALAFSIETLPFIDLEALKELTAEAQGEANPPPPNTTASSSSDASSKPKIPLLSQAAPPPPSPSHPVPAALDPETVTSLHLSSLTLSLLNHLTTVILPSFPTLSTKGSAQLGSDLGYLVNVVRALDVDWAEGEEWRELMEATEEEFKTRLVERRESERNGEE